MELIEIRKNLFSNNEMFSNNGAINNKNKRKKKPQTEITKKVNL